MKKAQGLPISTVILATLGLLVLVILFFITTGRLGVFSRGIQTCPHECHENAASCNAQGGAVLPGTWLDPRTGNKCEDSTLNKKVCCTTTPSSQVARDPNFG